VCSVDPSKEQESTDGVQAINTANVRLLSPRTMAQGRLQKPAPPPAPPTNLMKRRLLPSALSTLTPSSPTAWSAWLPFTTTSSGDMGCPSL
jgi:hypothetical protein